MHILKRLEVPREEFHFARDIIDRQLGQMVRLVDDLLDVSRITRGKIILQKERLDAKQSLLSYPQLAALLVGWKHRGNIERLMAGQEPRVGEKKAD